MLRAIEWRTVFGVVLIFGGPSTSNWMVNIDVTGMIGTGVLTTVIPVLAVAFLFRASRVPIRATLMLLSLPAGFSASLLLAFNGSINTEFFLASIAAAVVGGVLFLCGYQKDLVYNHDLVPTSSLLISAFILTLGPLFFIVFYQTETRPLLDFWQPTEVLLVGSILGGLFLLQKKEVATLSKFQFVGCYGAVLSAAMIIISYVSIYDDYWVKELDAGWTLPLFISVQLIALLSLLFAILFYEVVILVSIAKNKTEDIMLKNWHLSEAYIFLTFMIIAPQSIYETIAGAAG